jgi:hypothetical protein
MSTKVVVGAILIVAGALALGYQGFNYTKREKVLDLGPIQASADKEKHVSIPPLVGVVLLIGGLAVLLVPKRST